MKKKYILFFALCCLFFVFSTQAQNTIYVNASATGTNNGSSWANAFTDFQAGINAAATGDNVFVAKGTYQPAIGQSFSMKEGVKIYGGFAGTETSLSERDLSAGDTSILKGNGNRVVRNDNNGLTFLAVLNGFTITAGSPIGVGGGMYNTNVSPTITNCIFTSNNASLNGGGIYNNQSNITLINCIFRGNTAAYNGGAIFNDLSSPSIANCIFSGNKAPAGGGIYNDNASTSVITNCSFSGNYSTTDGGVFNENSSPIITNCVIYGNSNGAGVSNYNSSSNPVIAYSLIQGMNADAPNHNLDGTTDPKFVEAPLYSTAPFIGGDYHLSPGSAAINKGNNNALSTNDTADVARNSRIFDKANGGIVDLGAYEYQGNPEPPVITVQPSDTTVCNNATAAFEVTATGATLTYQWQSSSDGNIWNNINFATSDTLKLYNVALSDSGKSYRVLLNNVWGANTSNIATLKVFAQPVISSQPQPQSVDQGSPATFNVTTTGINLQYQWQKYINKGQGWNDIANATGSSFTISTVSKSDAASYQVIITGNCAQTISNQVTLTINDQSGIPNPPPPGHLPPCNSPVISLQPLSQSVCIGSNATFSVTASGALGYQWQTIASQRGKTTWENIENATSPTLTIPSVSMNVNNRQYRVFISGQCATTSESATLTVDSVQITSQPQDAYVKTTNGRSGKPVTKNITATFNVEATGQNLTYQWQYSLDRGVTWNNVSTATLSSLTVNNIAEEDDSTQYRVIVTGDCNSAISDVATLKVDENIKIGPIEIPSGQSKNSKSQARDMINKTQGYTIYPNPVTNHSLTIEGKPGNPINQINIYDMQGQLVYSTNTQQSNIILQLPSTLIGGTYLLQIMDKNQKVYSNKIIIETTGLMFY